MSEQQPRPPHVGKHPSIITALPALAEGGAIAPPPGFEPHEFVGREDRWCEIYNRPDRNPIHNPARPLITEGEMVTIKGPDGTVHGPFRADRVEELRDPETGALTLNITTVSDG